MSLQKRLEKEVRENLAQRLWQLGQKVEQRQDLSVTEGYALICDRERLKAIREWANAHSEEGLATLAEAAEDLVNPEIPIRFPFDPLSTVVALRRLNV